MEAVNNIDDRLAENSYKLFAVRAVGDEQCPVASALRVLPSVLIGRKTSVEAQK